MRSKIFSTANMLIWIAIHGLVGFGSFGEPSSGPDLSVFQPVTKVSKTVNIAGMRNRIETLLGGKLDVKSKPSSNSKGVKTFEQESLEREELESLENIEFVKNIQRRKRSIEDITDSVNQTEKNENSSDTSAPEITPSTKMSHIMRIAPRDRLSETQSGKIQKRDTSEIGMTSKLDSEEASTGNAETKSKQSSETTTAVLSSVTTTKPSSETSLRKSDEKGRKTLKGHYTFPPGFFRHRNFLHEAPLAKERADATESETTSKESKASGYNTQEAHKGDTTRGHEATIIVDIRSFGGQDLHDSPADLNHDFGQEQRQKGEQQNIVAAFPSQSLSTRMVASFVVTSLANLVTKAG